MGICIVLKITDMQVYYNLTAPIPQSEWYAVCQLNYFTNCIKINDRFLFGTMDTEVRENNAAYKVKAVIKSTTEHTFVRDSLDELESTPLVVLALDKDAIAPKDNFQNRVAAGAPVYNIPSEEQTGLDVAVISDDSSSEEEINIYSINDVGTVKTEIHLGKYADYELKLFRNNEELESPNIIYTYELENISEDKWNEYFMFEQTSYDSFRIYNFKTCTKGKLLVTATFTIPENGKELIRNYTIKLGRVY